MAPLPEGVSSVAWGAQVYLVKPDENKQLTASRQGL
jgi:hypothetical protein